MTALASDVVIPPGPRNLGVLVPGVKQNTTWTPNLGAHFARISQDYQAVGRIIKVSGTPACFSAKAWGLAKFRLAGSPRSRVSNQFRSRFVHYHQSRATKRMQRKYTHAHTHSHNKGTGLVLVLHNKVVSARFVKSDPINHQYYRLLAINCQGLGLRLQSSIQLDPSLPG